MLTDMLAGGQHVDRNNMPTAMLSGNTCRRTSWQGRHVTAMLSGKTCRRTCWQGQHADRTAEWTLLWNAAKKLNVYKN